ncbi:MAG: primosomal protein N' [Gammaproteobacteria bacterium]|nr:primosomal protein N' [Gammaproteobacteria bacterium]
MHVEVALPLPVAQTFTYRLEGVDLPAPGTRVLIPFQRTETIGWVVGPGDPTGIRGIRGVLDVLEPEASVPADLMRLARWISRYYAASLGLTLRSMLPALLSDRAREFVWLTAAGARALEGGTGDEAISGRAAAVLACLERAGGRATTRALRRTLGRRSAWPQIRRLRAAGFIEHRTTPPRQPRALTRKVVRLERWIPDLATREELFRRAPRQRACFELLEASGGVRGLAGLQRKGRFSRSVIQALSSKGLVRIEDREVLRDPFRGERPPKPVDHVPSEDQARAVAELLGGIDCATRLPFLLHGVTGSGKTFVYIQLLREVVTVRGGGAIVLVPEISLTAQTVRRFRAWFGDDVAVLHSGLSRGERYDQWRQVRAGKKKIVVGARSALFAPVRRLGAIIVDEEHESSYKQSEVPRYHARDAAVVRAHLSGAVCVLGSATPSLESWQNARIGKFRKIDLPERIGGRPMPAVEVVDPWHGDGGRGRRGSGLLSDRLIAAVEDRLARGEQSILLLNRRGYASFVQCSGCGAVRECTHCSISMTFHRIRNRLICHHCGHEEETRRRCSTCSELRLRLRGYGTEQVERAVGEAFPDARIARMDGDTTSGRGSHEEILERMRLGEVDLLLGTQMIAKGLDFHRVTLVGVIDADVGIHLPDFRASERSFQLLSQVAGRAGRGSLGGEAIIQSSIPEHYAIQAALRHDVAGFAERELEERRRPRYPPYVRLVNVVVSSADPETAAAGVDDAVGWIRSRLRPDSASDPEIVGPAPCPIERLHGRWRWHFFLRGGGNRSVTSLLHRFLADHRPSGRDLRIAVDRDPVSLL